MYIILSGWLGWAMVLGSFQCRGVLLLLHIVGQGPAVFATGAEWVGYIFYIFHLSSLSDVLTFGRRLNMTEILWFRLLNPNGSFNYCRGCPRLVLVNRLGLSLPKNSATINWPARHDLIVDWALKTPTQTNIILCSFFHLNVTITPYGFVRNAWTFYLSGLGVNDGLKYRHSVWQPPY